MKTHLLTLATLVLVVTACSKTDTETPDIQKAAPLPSPPLCRPESPKAVQP